MRVQKSRAACAFVIFAHIFLLFNEDKLKKLKPAIKYIKKHTIKGVRVQANDLYFLKEKKKHISITIGQGRKHEKNGWVLNRKNRAPKKALRNSWSGNPRICTEKTCASSPVCTMQQKAAE